VAAGALHEHVESPRHSDSGHQGSVPQRTPSCQLRQGHTACSPRALLAWLVHAMAKAVVSMTELEWARLKVEGPYPLRRGAWYRVTEFFPDEVVVDVNRKPVTLPLSVLDVRGELPRRWTIVPRPTNAVRLPKSWGERYGVCPSCKSRALLRGSAQTMRCPRCRGVFPVGWDEYLHSKLTRRDAPHRSGRARRR